MCDKNINEDFRKTFIRNKASWTYLQDCNFDERE